MKNYALSGGILIVVLLVVAGLYKIPATAQSPYVFAVVGIVALVLIKFSEPFIDLFQRRSNRYHSGWTGEATIRRELENLGADYTVFGSVILDPNKGNLDFVVVAPQGVFNLEVKNYAGDVNYNGFTLTLNGRPFRDKDLFFQVHGQTSALKNYLQEAVGANMYIHSVLVFANPRARMRFGYNVIRHVQIIQKDFLLGLFLNFPKINYPVPREDIEEALLATYRRA